MTQLTVFPPRRSLADTDETTIKSGGHASSEEQYDRLLLFRGLKDIAPTHDAIFAYPSIERDCHDLPRDEIVNGANVQYCQSLCPIPIGTGNIGN